MDDMPDVIVIGAGPAGCACGIFLARSGVRVTILDAQKHPRHHIGESLLPASMPILARLGICSADLEARFQPKYGARFYDPETDRMAAFDFDPAPGATIPSFQVLREDFDAMLAEKAKAAGCEVLENASVESVEENAAEPQVMLRDQRALVCRFLVDATGRAAILATKRKTRHVIADHGRVAIYNYFADLPPHDELDPRFITMYLFEGGWVWLIPLKGGRTSVGIVYRQIPGLEPASRNGAAASSKKPEALFWRAVRTMPRLEQRLAGARVTDEYRAIGDYSYQVSEKIGDHFALIGDAAGFLDPIFSSGVHLALCSAERAAAAILEKLQHNSDAGLVAYGAHLDQGYRVFAAFVDRFYNRQMVRNLFFMPNKPPPVHAAITRILAGYVWDPGNPVLRMLGADRRG